MRSIVFVFLFLLFSVNSVLADYNQSKEWFYSRDWQDRIRIQFLLVFTGDYDTVVDGAFGPRTYAALTSFQKKNKFSQDGALEENELLVLQNHGLDLVRRVGFETRHEAETGLTLGLPAKLFEQPKPTRLGNRWQAYDGSIELETLRLQDNETSYRDLFNRLTKPNQGRSIDTKLIRNDFFVVSGLQDGRDFFMRVMRTENDSRGFSLTWDSKHSVFMDRVALAMSSSLAVYKGGEDDELGAMTSAPEHPSVDDQTAATGDQTASAPVLGPKGNSSGSGFIVTDEGHIATNAHVVGHCKSLEIANHGEAALVAADEENDLAIIQLKSGTAEHFAQFRANQPIVRGEEVFVLGYPFAQILDNNLNFTHGVVSSLAGIKGDIRHFMVSAPVQPGNSGGPVLDRTGALIGTVVSRLDKFKTLKVAGDLPENINFAIRGRLMSTFMESLGLAPSYNTITSIKTPTRIDEEAARYTVQILCRN
ncbi:MAG: trypsin-like peptidase domain-containing protein [Roseibium sp.]|uniref:serine protease n=1 Tax=Roseibium sp. TaxID=1936156 RepID=UPI001B135008|nr:serine protease [Roseibium sp.]MBO6894582.1 trypsin-like peptidase domain-containing protein [Roseibium sp.]MBO6928839.1 trypsin-like peptidase domain-containing protein [Roseibium sp.]